MSISRRKFIKRNAAVTAALTLGQVVGGRPGDAAARPAAGPFQPNWDSLKQYEYPERI